MTRCPTWKSRFEGCRCKDRSHVDCDDNCGAYREPETIEEFKIALRHWEGHGYLNGCSHGC